MTERGNKFKAISKTKEMEARGGPFLLMQRRADYLTAKDENNEDRVFRYEHWQFEPVK